MGFFFCFFCARLSTLNWVYLTCNQIAQESCLLFLTAISHRGLRNCFFFLRLHLLFSCSFRTFSFLFSLEFYFPFLFGLSSFLKFVLNSFSILSRSLILNSSKFFSLHRGFFIIHIFEFWKKCVFTYFFKLIY